MLLSLAIQAQKVPPPRNQTMVVAMKIFLVLFLSVIHQVWHVRTISLGELTETSLSLPNQEPFNEFLEGFQKTNDNRRLCVWPVQQGFTDSIRERFGGRLEWVHSMG